MTIKIFSSKEDRDNLFMRIQLVVMNDKVNLNGAVCTKDFIQSIVDNHEQYEHLPLFCDLDALRQHRDLSHKYNEERDEFDTAQIGSFESFSTVEIDGVLYLVGTVRISKRNKYIVEALEELAERDELKFSYEIETGSTVEVDGVEYITSSPNNRLVGVAVVTQPAIPDARALLVAEQLNEKEDDPVDKLNKDKTNPENNEPEVKNDPTSTEETAACGTNKEKAEETAACGTDKEKAEETAACGTDKKEAATDPEQSNPDDQTIEETSACGTDKEKAEKTSNPDEGKEQIIELSERNKALEKENNQLKDRLAAMENELNQKKEAEETQAKAAKRKELLDKVSQVLNDEEIMMLEDALDDLDENAINAALAEKLIKEKILKKEQTAKQNAGLRITDSITQKANKWITE